MNKVILIGRIGKDAETMTFDSGAVKVSFTMATSEKYKGRDGQPNEATEWHNIEMWGDRAIKLSQYLLKGKQVMVEGKLRYNEYEKDGVKRKVALVSCQQLEFLGDKQRDGQQAQQSPQQPVQQQPVPYVHHAAPQQPDPTGQFPPVPQQQGFCIPPEEYAGDDELPF